MDVSWGSSNLVFPERPKEGSRISSDSGGIGPIGQLSKLIWPKSDFKAFSRLIRENPEEMHSRHGDMQETLLHRWVDFDWVA